jgi:hypothetical protein
VAAAQIVLAALGFLLLEVMAGLAQAVTSRAARSFMPEVAEVSITKTIELMELVALAVVVRVTLLKRLPVALPILAAAAEVMVVMAAHPLADQVALAL